MPTQDKTPLIYEVQGKTARWLINSWKPNCSRVHQLTNRPTHQPTTLSTRQLINSQAYHPTNS